MFTTYILYSNSIGKYYTGQTNNLRVRLKRHNSSLEKSTKHGAPWELIYSMAFKSRSEAMTMEKRIKNRGAKRFLKDLEV